MGSILRQGLALSAARYIEQIIGLLTPVILVRTIGPTAFGEYRLFGLLVTTVALLIVFDMPRSLLFFFVRLDSRGRGLYVGQTVLFLLATTTIAALLVFIFGNALPAGMKNLLHEHGFLLAAFLLVSNLGLLLDVLPNAAGQIRWQAQAILATALFRAALIISAAIIFQRLEEVLIATLIAACMRLGVLGYFIARYCGILLLPLDKEQFGVQLRYALPFGVGALLWSMRKQAEQWIVATVFSPAMFGIFSVATMLLMPFEVLRGVLGNLLLPRMSHLHSLGQHDDLLRLNNRGNVIISAVMFPAIAALFAFSDEVLRFLFTKEYVSGSPVLRIYLVQTLISTEITTLMNVFGQGAASMRYEAVILPFAVTTSLISAWYYGLPGAAIGSLLATFVMYALCLRRLSMVMSFPIARLQDWKNLGKILSVSAICAVIVRFSVDLMKPSTPIAAIVGPAAVLLCYAAILFVTGYYRTLLEIAQASAHMNPSGLSEADRSAVAATTTSSSILPESLSSTV